MKNRKTFQNQHALSGFIVQLDSYLPHSIRVLLFAYIEFTLTTLLLQSVA